MNILLSATLYSVQIILPLMGVLIVCCCLDSLFGNLSSPRTLITLFDRTNRKNISIKYWENSIGRDKHCDVTVNSPLASRSHAVLFRRNEGWYIADTNSKCGVFLNGEKINGAEKVHINDVLKIGEMDFELKRAQESQSFFKFGKRKRDYAPSSLLIMVTAFQFLSLMLPLISQKPFNMAYLGVFGALAGLSWTYFAVAKYIFRRINFEIETLGIFLSGMGIITQCVSNLNMAYMQIAAVAVGMMFFLSITSFLQNPDFAMKFRPYVAVGAAMLLAVNLVFGVVKNGSKNWMILGPFSVQPSEFVKVAFVFFGASTLRHLQTAKNLTGFLFFSCVCMGALFLMGDFGSACVFFVTFILMAFMRSGSFRTVFLTCAAAVIGLVFILKFKPYIVDRFCAWRHVWQHINDSGYQQSRVLSYCASGGVFGLGPGKGYLRYIFAALSDLVFGVICEEYGVFMALVVVMCVIFMAFYARSASIRSRSAFYSIASCGAAGMMVFQMMMNVFGSTDILPLTGVTFPFISAGGSSMISVWGLLAFIKSSDERTYAVKR